MGEVSRQPTRRALFSNAPPNSHSCLWRYNALHLLPSLLTQPRSEGRKKEAQELTYPKTMHPRLGGVPVHPRLAIRVSRQSIHDGPADGAGPVDLQPEVVVQPRYRVIVLMNHEVFAPTVVI